MADMLAQLPARLWRGLLDLVTPGQCLHCRTPVVESACLCMACWARLQHLDDPVCDMLGTPFAYDQGAGMLSPAALAEPPGWDRARAAVIYDEVARTIASSLKYGDRQEAGLLMARMMLRAGRKLIAESDVIIPVPLHRWRLWKRRFNQSAYLAQRIAEDSGRQWVAQALVRRKRTRSQVGLDHDSRRKNVKGAFAVPEAQLRRVAGKSVLLIDDVRTTGATAEACAAALKRAGARNVSLLTFALVPAPAKIHI